MKKTKFVLAIIALATISSCKNNPQTPQNPPGPTTGCIILPFLSQKYNCGSGAPGTLVKNGKGSIKASVVSANAMQFILNVLYTPANWLGPLVTTQNGTQSFYNKIIESPSTGGNDTWYVDVPSSDAYSIKVYYIEYGANSPSPSTTGNNSSCANPVVNSTNACYRWFKQHDFANGYYPNCSPTSGLVLPIDAQDPGGFKGNCN